MRIILLAAVVLVLCVSALAADKPDFSGTWRADTAGSAGEPLIIEQNGDELTIRCGDSGPAGKTDVACNTMGKECKGTLGGDSVSVSYWYNGPALIEMAIEGKNRDRVTETRRRLSEDGQKMLVEVITIVPTGKDIEKLVLSRDRQVAGGTTVAP